jgi:DNA-binding transcriptional MerR regulator
MYSTSAFARLAGVTVKALRHYERCGLLRPQRTASGYRQYGQTDLQRLERVLALRSLKLPLATVKTLFARPATSLRAHRERLETRRARLDRAIDALKYIELQPAADGLDAFVRHATWERWEAERQRRAASEIVRAPDRASPAKLALFRDLEAALADDPTGRRARQLAARWQATVDPDTWAACKNRATWPDGMRRYVASLYDVTPERWERVVAFIEASNQPSSSRQSGARESGTAGTRGRHSSRGDPTS